MTLLSTNCSVRQLLFTTSAYITARSCSFARYLTDLTPRLPRRLIDLIAEDNAIEDTMYHLHRALNAGRIDLERFLRVNLISAIQLVLQF